MRRTGIITLGLVLLAATAGSAQRGGGLREVRRSWGEFGFAFVGGTPSGQFSDLVNEVGGVNANLTVHLDRRGALGLRIDGAYLLYGDEHRLLPLAGTGGLLALDMNTAFYVASVRAGPELVFGSGRVRPYAFATAGISYFATETTLGDCCGTTNYDDQVASFAGGGGLRIDLSRRHRRPISLDLGATFVQNGAVNYLREGDITSNPDGSFTFQPVRSEANMFLLQLGVSVGLR